MWVIKKKKKKESQEQDVFVWWDCFLPLKIIHTSVLGEGAGGTAPGGKGIARRACAN